MRSRLWAIGLAAVVLALGLVAFLPLRTAADGPGYGKAHGAMWMGLPDGTLPPELGFLANLSPTERFESFRGGTITFVNQTGTEVPVNVTPGTVTGLTSQSISVTPNGQTLARDFAITRDTVVHAMPERGTVQALTTGDRVVVVTVGADQDASLIAKVRVDGQDQMGAPTPAPGTTPAPSQ